VDHLKFGTDLVEGLLVKYSVQCKVSGHHGGDGKEGNRTPVSKKNVSHTK
jgi:hypothetical protein